MKLKLDISPDLVAMMAAEIAAGERAVSAAMRQAGAGLKASWPSVGSDEGSRPRMKSKIAARFEGSRIDTKASTRSRTSSLSVIPRPPFLPQHHVEHALAHSTDPHDRRVVPTLARSVRLGSPISFSQSRVS